jgi:hypothetical protein
MIATLATNKKTLKKPLCVMPFLNGRKIRASRTGSVFVSLEFGVAVVRVVGVDFATKEGKIGKNYKE